MPYKIRKAKCKQSDGGSGSYVLSYTDKKGKKHRACNTSKKKARGQIPAIEMESIRLFVREFIAEEALGLHGAGMSEKDLASRLGFEFTPNYAKGAKPNSEGQNHMKLTLAELRSIIKEAIQQNMKQQGSLKAKTERELEEDEFTYAIAKAAKKGEKSVDIDGEKFPVKMSKDKAKDILGNQKQSK